MSTQFSFKCDTDTNYSLGFGATVAQSQVSVVLQNAAGTQIVVAPRIRSIDGRLVNKFFRDLPQMSYQDRAIAAKVYQVVVDLVPTHTPLTQGGVQTGQFLGNIQLLLQY
ncbi:hypothetical protein ACT2FY_01070 [Paraburkholderia fungorum]|uniref:hypothetical protein n=1 Tax=Paraburkholderia fungorum TaxID=134537 RepID=UPI00402BDF10